MTTKKSTLKNIVFDCVLCSEHYTDMLNVKSVGKEHLTSSFVTAIYRKDSLFLGFSKEVQKEPPEVVYK